MPIGEVITQSDLKSLAAWSGSNLSNTAYVAPTVYRPANGVSNWNYYSSAKDVLQQWFYINKVPGYTKVTPAGNVPFNSAAATTLGVGIDFFAYSPITGTTIPVPYEWVKQWVYANNKFVTIMFRFYKTNGTGPFYAILDNRTLNISATILQNIPSGKIIPLQQFHRSVQMLKLKYNALAAFVLELSKRQKTAVEQQIFDESLLTLLNFEKQLRALKGVDIVWSNAGQISGPAIGIVPLVWVAIIVVSGIVAMYAVDKILAYAKDAKALEESNDTMQFVEDQRLKIAQALKAGTITRDDANYLDGKLNETKAAAEKNINDVSTKTDDDIFSKITKLLLVGGSIYLLSKMAN